MKFDFGPITKTKPRFKVGYKVVDLECPNCKSVFTRRSGLTQVTPSLKGKVTCCSKRCAYLFNKRGLSDSERMAISESSVLRVYKYK